MRSGRGPDATPATAATRARRAPEARRPCAAARRLRAWSGEAAVLSRGLPDLGIGLHVHFTNGGRESAVDLTDADNCRAAFAWSRERSETEVALTLASSLQPLWLALGRVHEGLAWFDAVLIDDPWFGRAWHSKAQFESAYATFKQMAVILGS